VANVSGNNQCPDQKDPSRSWEYLYGQSVGKFRWGSHIKLIFWAPRSADSLPPGWEAIFDCCAIFLPHKMICV